MHFLVDIYAEHQHICLCCTSVFCEKCPSGKYPVGMSGGNFHDLQTANTKSGI